MCNAHYFVLNMEALGQHKNEKRTGKFINQE